MKLLVILSLVSVAISSDVVELTDSNFGAEIGKESVALVEFFAPWCGHCKKLAPEYEKAATELKNNDPPVTLIKVDCTANQETCKKYDVSGYPTLKIFKGGEFSEDYNGGRDKNGIVALMASKAGPTVKVLEDVAAYEKTVGKKLMVLCLHEGDIPSGFKKAADALSGKYKFFATNSKEVIEASGEKINTIVIIRPDYLKNKMEPSRVVQENADTATKTVLESFITKNIYGICGQLTRDNANDFGKPLVTGFFPVNFNHAGNIKQTNYYRNRLIKAVKDFSKLNCAFANSHDFESQFKEFGLNEDLADKPQVYIQSDLGKFPMKTEFNVDNLKTFFQDYLDGNIEAHVKSEDIPEDNDDPVTVVVGKTFNDIVMDENKDVLIEFYAPWCGHCKKLVPVYDELGEKFANNEDVVIAKMDATANDVPPMFDVSGFPTIFWVPKGKNAKPERYNLGREVADFTKFIEGKGHKAAKTEL